VPACAGDWYLRLHPFTTTTLRVCLLDEAGWMVIGRLSCGRFAPGSGRVVVVRSLRSWLPTRERPLGPLSWPRRLLARLLARKAFSSLLEGSRGETASRPFLFFIKGALQVGSPRGPGESWLWVLAVLASDQRGALGASLLAPKAPRPSSSRKFSAFCPRAPGWTSKQKAPPVNQWQAPTTPVCSARGCRTKRQPTAKPLARTRTQAAEEGSPSQRLQTALGKKQFFPRLFCSPPPTRVGRIRTLSSGLR